jgi:ribonuclease HIII
LINLHNKAHTYYRYLNKCSINHGLIHENVYFTTKGEQYHLSVAAASILARVVELNSLKQLSESAGMPLPIGAGHAVDEVAAQLLRDGKDLNQFAKLHFANTKKAEHLL